MHVTRRSIATDALSSKQVKAKHHFWSSLTVGGALYWATGSSAALAGTMVGGFLIDSDHVIDQLWSIRHGAPFRRERIGDDPPTGGKRASSITVKIVDHIRPRKLLRLPLIFHSYELLAVMASLALYLRTPFLIGLLSGYVLHLALDLLRHHHEFRSPFFYLISYRLSQGFRRDRLIKADYL